jgi:hypothetical protein
MTHRVRSAAARLSRGLVTWSVAAAVLCPGLRAQETLTIDEALALAFPTPAAVERQTAFLTEEEVARASELAGPDVVVSQSVVTYYIGVRGSDTLGLAYFDRHRVRTLPEVLMIVVTPAGTIDRIDVIRFTEPPEYRPPDGWLGTFLDRGLTEDLSLKGDIIAITGATLTSRAVTHAARRTLAVHEVIRTRARR